MFAKVFRTLFYGSLTAQPDPQLVFVCLLTHGDIDGHVQLPPAVIATVTGLSLERVIAALQVLESPDAKSNSEAQEGRRLEIVGEARWQIVNHALYRGMRDEEARRAQNREAKQRQRSKPASAKVSRSQPRSANAEAEAEAEAEALERGLPPSLELSPAPSGADSPARNGREAIAGVIASLAKSKRMPRKAEDWRVGAWDDARAIATSSEQADSMMELAGWLRKNGQTQDRIAISRMFRLIVQHGVKNPMAYFSHNGEALNAILGARAVEHAEAEQREFQKADAAVGLSRRG